MLTRTTIARLNAAILIALAMGAATLAEDSSSGVIRVSDQPPANAGTTLAKPGSSAPAGVPQPGMDPAQCQGEGCPAPCEGWSSGLYCPGCGHCCCCCGCCSSCLGRIFGKDEQGRGLLGRCGLFQCTSNCGWRFLDAHGYCMTYAVSPWYCDGRDGRVYAAYGYGAPMTVPLAPTVTNQYNYGWGIPSGRLTPISRVAPRPGTITAAVAPY